MLHLKIVNTFVQNNVYILKQFVQGTQKWLWNFSWPGGFKDDATLAKLYLFLCLKYHIYSCKFQNKRPNFSGFKIFVKNNRECEYIIAKKRDKLSLHLKKWRFEL